MQELHPTQQKLLTILKENINNPLTIREIQKLMEVSSPSVVQHHLKQLEKKGYLRRNPLNPKDYQILAKSPDKQITYLNLYRLEKCRPTKSISDGNPIDRIPIATKILGFNSAEAFMVKAKGDSMSPKINDKDLVIAKKTNNIAENGDIVVCVDKNETKIKKIQKSDKGEKTILISLNDKYEPFLAGDDFKIEGIVKGVYSYNI